MKRLHVFTLALAVMVFSAGVAVAARPQFKEVDVTNPRTGEVKKTISIPEHAVEVAPGLYYLGQAVDNGQVVEGYARVHYKKGFAKPGTVCGNGICEPGENINKCPADCGGDTEPTDPVDPASSCYGYLASGAKWKKVEPYIVNPRNNAGLAADYILANLESDISKWEAAANYDILGSGSLTDETLEADTDAPDGQNEVYFGDIAQQGAIGVTIIWGIFGGPPQRRELVEWDMIFDDVDFDWSADCESEDCAKKMDFENIATHELGHSAGMGDLYTSECSEMTMYGYAANGETKKRTLEAGDIYGIYGLYH